MIETNLLVPLLVGIFVGATAGYLGSFMVLKRMALVGDALSHVALPGMAIALAFNFSPILGAFAALTIAIFGVWYFEKTTTLYPEALIGIFFTASLALGMLITPEPDLLEALFGNIEKINLFEAMITVILSILIFFQIKAVAKKLILGVISEELVKSVGTTHNKINLIYLLAVGIIVALGVKFVGTLLMGALVIVPAASAKNISGSMNNYYLLSVIFGITSAVIGVLTANLYHLPSGPTVVLTSIFIFILTYLAKKITPAK